MAGWGALPGTGGVPACVRTTGAYTPILAFPPQWGRMVAREEGEKMGCRVREDNGKRDGGHSFFSVVETKGRFGEGVEDGGFHGGDGSRGGGFWAMGKLAQ